MPSEGTWSVSQSVSVLIMQNMAYIRNFSFCTKAKFYANAALLACCTKRKIYAEFVLLLTPGFYANMFAI